LGNLATDASRIYTESCGIGIHKLFVIFFNASEIPLVFPREDFSLCFPRVIPSFWEGAGCGAGMRAPLMVNHLRLPSN
jgi:hypothetical protein